MKNLLLCMVISLCSVSVSANDAPYAGQDTREIKALSQERVSGLLEGKGLGYAKVAELNGYPGPAHVLELAEELNLSEAQIESTKAIFKKMKNEARDLGAQLVEAERKIDVVFQKNKATEKLVRSSLEEIGNLEARLRACHVVAHLSQKAVLTKHQIHTYNMLRGYEGGEHKHHNHH
jgi:Spy/CpxP family protein refolding chaperone